MDFRRQRCRGRAREPKPAAVDVRRSLVIQQIGEQGGHGAEPADVAVADLAPESPYRKPVGHGQSARRHQRPHDGHAQPVDVVDRQHAHRGIVCPYAMAGNYIHAGRHQVGMRQDHALGVAGGARGVHQKAGCVGVRGRARRCGAAVILRPVGTFVRVEADDGDVVVDAGDGLFEHVTLLVRAQHETGAGMAEDIGENARAGDKVERCRQITAGRDAGEAQRRPDRVLRGNGHRRARREAQRVQLAGDLACSVTGGAPGHRSTRIRRGQPDGVAGCPGIHVQLSCNARRGGGHWPYSFQ